MPFTTSHTPSPWFVGYGTKACAVYMKPASEGWLVRDQVARFARDAEGEANARLIAAAPDLLKELDVRVGDLVMLRKAIEAGDPRNELFVRIDDMLRETRAAITKAA